MKKIISSPFRYKNVQISIIPNFQGLWGLYEYAGPRARINYEQKWAIKIENKGSINGLFDSEINEALSHCFNAPVTLDRIKKKSHAIYSSGHNSYFAAILKIKKLKELI